MSNNHASTVSAKFRDKFQETTWGEFLRVFLKSEDFTSILTQLETEVNSGYRFTPALKEITKPFKLCDYSSLKVVIVGGVPVDGVDQSDGLVFSASRMKDTPPDLKWLINSIQESVENHYKGPHLNDLSRWAKQGVLLLPFTFTRRISQLTQTSKPFKHESIWKDFMAYLLDSLAQKHPHLIWVFIGENASKYEVHLRPTNPRLSVEYPRANLQKWAYNDVWNWVNQNLLSQGYNSIMW